MKPNRPLASAVFLLHLPMAFAVSDEEFIAQMYGLVPGTMIDFCSSAVPGLSSQIDETAKAFNARLLKASTPFLDRIRSEGGVGDGPPKEQLDEVRKKILSDLKNVDAPKYCAGLIQKLQTADTDAMAAATEVQYRKYLATAKAKEQGTK